MTALNCYECNPDGSCKRCAGSDVLQYGACKKSAGSPCGGTSSDGQCASNACGGSFCCKDRSLNCHECGPDGFCTSCYDAAVLQGHACKIKSGEFCVTNEECASGGCGGEFCCRDLSLRCHEYGSDGFCKNCAGTDVLLEGLNTSWHSTFGRRTVRRHTGRCVGRRLRDDGGPRCRHCRDLTEEVACELCSRQSLRTGGSSGWGSEEWPYGWTPVVGTQRSSHGDTSRCA